MGIRTDLLHLLRKGNLPRYLLIDLISLKKKPSAYGGRRRKKDEQGKKDQFFQKTHLVSSSELLPVTAGLV